MSALAIRNLHKRFGSVDVLKGINLEIDRGDFTVLVGPSGCGKSTLLNIIAGLETATSGEIEIADRMVNAIPPKDRDIAMVFQSYALYPSMTVRQNITFGMECRNVAKPEREAAVARVAKLLQIEPLLNRKPGQLSGGQRQRVAMGRALVRDPKLFLFDEPLSNLDAKLRVEMRAEIKLLHARIGATIVYVTHDQIEAMTMATRIAVMHAGAVQQFADPDTIYNRPANIFVARFMGAPPMNTLAATLRAVDGVPHAMLDGTVGLPVPDAPARYLNRPVILGIRPECLAEPQRRFGAAPARLIEAQVEMTEPTGAETMVTLAVAGQRAIGRVAPDTRMAIGAPASFSVDTRKLCLFDPETENLIAA